MGREVKLVLDEDRGAGEHGLPVPSLALAHGVYFLKLESREGTAITRLVLAK